MCNNFYLPNFLYLTFTHNHHSSLDTLTLYHNTTMADTMHEKVTTTTAKPEQSAQPAQADTSSAATANATASAMANEPEVTPKLAAEYEQDNKDLDEFFAAEGKTASQVSHS